MTVTDGDETASAGLETATERRIRRDIMTAAAASAPALGGGHVAELESFLSDYNANVSLSDLQASDPIDVLGAALSHRKTAHRRVPGQGVVKVHTPSVEEYGWSNGHTIVEIVTDDMPFLVDSVSAALSGRGIGIHLVIHPQFDVERDAHGDLVDLRPALHDPKSDRIHESWIHFDIDRESDPEVLAELADMLTRVLADIRASVEDWSTMQETAERLAVSLSAEPIPSVDPTFQAEAAAFMRWLADDHFTFLGYRQYQLVDSEDGLTLAVIPGSGRGILRGGDERSHPLSSLPEAVRSRALDPDPLLLTKANSKSTVHRSAYMDYVGVKRFDDAGRVVGEERFLGLYAATAYNQSVVDIPVLRAKLDRVMHDSGFAPDSHSGKDLLQFLETYPRDEMFQARSEELLKTAVAVLGMQERRRTRLFMRRDPYERFMSCLVYLPRDRYTTTVRQRIESILRTALNAESIEYRTRVTESVLARLHFVVRVAPGAPLSHVDEELLENEVAAAVRSWEDQYNDEMEDAVGEEDATRLSARFSMATAVSYKEAFPARTGVSDIRHLDRLAPESTELNLYRPYEAGERIRRLKIYRRGEAVSLSRILPILQHMGVDVTDERPFTLIDDQGEEYRIYDLGLVFPDDEICQANTVKARFEDAFLAIWRGRAEDDGFNTLILRAELNWREAALLRALVKYMRQARLSFSQNYIQAVLLNHPQIVGDLIDLFDARFDPDLPISDDARDLTVNEIHARIVARLDDIASLDVDRILRFLATLVMSTVRTSYFRHDHDFRRDDGEGVEDDARPFKISFKLRPEMIRELPEPRPKHEIWVYSPEVEGVHLRFAAVARGGLRWSDRPEDFRTEILGLVKAQAVKNSVIVPAGAKGGFYGKKLPDSSDREAYQRAGRHAYREFVSGLLDLTDNRLDTAIVTPLRVIRHDGDDPYLVVAADKGTATFSDLANSISKEYGFWLGDAFASGGSEGYDHKAMGITARGAWEAVKRHFREHGIDTQTQDFTCVGIGDMSGDVFGNGMLLSDHIQLVAAFDHRHVFLDPTPDPAVSFAERRRLFELPRSSWDDYDRTLISDGGGVFPRSTKAIPVTEAVRTSLGIIQSVDALTPNEMIKAILRAKVGLLWNGGIGTYVKARHESNADVGDKTNDAVRVNGGELRCVVVGEGGNLGLTQSGRIEAALAGVQLNTDAIDNSAGVDTSDHEVNIKILLDTVVRQGDLTEKQRSDLLQSMTATVAELVLEHNYGQNLSLGNARTQAPGMLSVHGRMMRELSAAGELDRALEFLPDDDTMREREVARIGLTSPELSVLLAYSKMTLAASIPADELAADPYFQPVLHNYFPPEMRQRFADRMPSHPLAAEIITTVVVNELVNRGGITFIYRAREETGASDMQILRAYTFARDVFDLPAFWARVRELDNEVTTAAQSRVYLEARRLLDRVARWMIQTRGSDLDLSAEFDRFHPTITALSPLLPQMLRGAELSRLHRLARDLAQVGVPDGLALDTSALLYRFMLLDVVQICERTQADPEQVARLYFCVSERYEVDDFLTRISTLPRDGRWKALARQALRGDLYSALASLTAQVVRTTDPSLDATQRLDEWELANWSEVSRVRSTLQEISSLESHDLSTLSVALRAMRTMVSQSQSRA